MNDRAPHPGSVTVAQAMKYYVAYYLLVALGAAICFLAPRVFARPWQRWAAFAVPAALVAGFLWRYSEPSRFLNDFKKAYYPAAHLVRDRAELATLYNTDDPVSGFVNLPVVAWLFVPFTLWTDHQGGLVYTAIGLAAVAAACLWLIKLTGTTGWAVATVVGLFVINGPLFNSLREGNTTHVLLLAVVALLWAMQRRHDPLAGIALAAIVLVKPPLALLAAPLLLRQRWLALASAAAAVTCVGGLSLALYGWDIHHTWYQVAVEPYSEHPLGAFNAQSLNAAMARLISGDKYAYNWTPIDEYGPAFTLTRIAIVILLVSASLLVWWRTRASSAGRVGLSQELSIALVLALIVSPASWAHYYSLLLIPFALAVSGELGVPDDRRWWAALAVIVLLASAPVRPLATRAPLLDELAARVLASHILFGGLLLLGFALAVRWRWAHTTDEGREGVVMPSAVVSSAG